MALALVGVVRAEAETDDCCADKCKKACPAAATKNVVVTDKCTCAGKKDKDNCKCEACKCEKKPAPKCTCEGKKDKDNCACDECKCMKKVQKVLRLGKGGVLLMLWKIAAPEKVAACCEATAKHNVSVKVKGSAEDCCKAEGPCPFRAAGKRVWMPPHPIVMPVPPMAPIAPLFPHPVPAPIAGIPYPTPVAPPAPPMVRNLILSAPSMVPCTATVAVPPPVAAMRFVAHEGQVKMAVTAHGDTAVVSEQMRMKVADGCTVDVSVADGQVLVHCDCVTAKADSVVKTGHGERIILEGHVKFEYHKGEQTVEASADRVVYDPSTGQFEIKTATSIK